MVEDEKDDLITITTTTTTTAPTPNPISRSFQPNDSKKQVVGWR